MIESCLLFMIQRIKLIFNLFLESVGSSSVNGISRFQSQPDQFIISLISIEISLSPMKKQKNNIPQSKNFSHLPSLTQIQKNLIKDFEDNKQHSLHPDTEISQADILIKGAYVLDRGLLQRTTIRPNIRARIRTFIMEQCCRQLITRDAGALACYYIDLYLKRKGPVQVQDIQTMAISCLMLARKQQEGKGPIVSYTVFNRDSILLWEKRVAKTLEYLLSPPTHFTLGEHVVKKWELFTSNQTHFTTKFTSNETGPNLILRSFYEQLDCLQLVLQTFRWDLQSVVLNMFYLHAYILNVPEKPKPHQLSAHDFSEAFYSRDDPFTIVFQRFLQSYSKTKKFRLDQDLGLYLRMFVGLRVSQGEFEVLNNQPNYRTLRVWDKLQTYNRQAYELARAIMQRIRNR